ncbi:MAG: GNAT family N-acetyltransferase [Oscillospiraceae bacterium]|nr:GNAT family N-acetyltransferase [Oscillospiraceae bacterium]
MIRVMTVGDYPQVYALWRGTPGMGLREADDSQAGIERFLKRNPASCFVAEEDGNIIGVILSGHDGRRGYIYHTAVAPAYRKRGIARKLVEKAMDALEKEGINKAALVVFERNGSGNSFWEHLGFSVRNDLVYRNKVIREQARTDT